MDYDDLVDQFIVNDHNEPVKNDSEAAELMKIHLKTLIRSRQVALRTAQLDRVKDRNRKFEAMKKEICGGAAGAALNNVPSGQGGGIQNGEKRRRILKIVPAGEEDELIPCRLELDHEGYKLSEVLLLPSNSDQPPDTLSSLSAQLCQDYDLPVDSFQPAISRCLKDQVEEWHVYQGAMEGMKEALPFEEIGPVPVRLDIIVGLHRLEDQLEVDLNPAASNTDTMRRFVAALRSPDERVLPEGEYSAFRPLILHNLLEQLGLWRKAIVFGGYHRDPRSNNLKFHDGDVAVLLNDPSPAPATSVRRHFAHTNTFTPILSTLALEELDKIEAGRERESRRRRRTGATVPVANPTAAKRSVTGASAGASVAIANNLTGTVRSPPRTLPTPTSYRGSLHRIQLNNNSDDEAAAPRKRGRKSKY